MSYLDALLVSRAFDQSVDVDAWQVNGVRIELTDLNDLFDLNERESSETCDNGRWLSEDARFFAAYFSDCAFGGLGHGHVEVVGGLAEHEISGLVSLPALDEGEVAGDGLLHNISLAIEYSRLNFQSISKVSVESSRVKFGVF